MWLQCLRVVPGRVRVMWPTVYAHSLCVFCLRDSCTLSVHSVPFSCFLTFTTWRLVVGSGVIHSSTKHLCKNTNILRTNTRTDITLNLHGNLYDLSVLQRVHLKPAVKIYWQPAKDLVHFSFTLHFQKLCMTNVYWFLLLASYHAERQRSLNTHMLVCAPAWPFMLAIRIYIVWYWCWCDVCSLAAHHTLRYRTNLIDEIGSVKKLSINQAKQSVAW
jgi:hypothetical protein